MPGRTTNNTSTTNSMTYFTVIESPLSPLLLTSDGAALTGLYMSEYRHGPAALPGNNWAFHDLPAEWVGDPLAAPLPDVASQLESYFAGRLTSFDLPLLLEGTDFQRKVWAELCKIPYGVTISYGELANRVGNPKGSRAVGLANGHNPISIIVPCHRVIGSNGKLTGYGGGLPRKAALLDFEFSVLVNGPLPFTEVQSVQSPLSPHYSP
jgi:methylated-DNA-[protein]-cysteine S-methyltransferase